MASEMDRVLEKKRSFPWRLASGLLALAVIAHLTLGRANTSTLAIDPSRITTAQVTTGSFVEYYPFPGTVEPVVTVYLDVEEGGRVEEILVDGGQPVERGDPILRLSNTTLQRNSIDTETRLVENLNMLRDTQLNLARNALQQKDALLDLDYRILELEKTFARYEQLLAISGSDSPLPREAYERTRDELAYLREKRTLLRERIKQESILAESQIRQAEESIERLNLSRELLNKTVEGLTVRAPISGFLSSISAQVGENLMRGQRIGQIDQLDEYKISVRIDQYYISRVRQGASGTVNLDGETYRVTIDKIYPEIVQDAFVVDAQFDGAVPPLLRRGQTLTVELTFGGPAESLMVARGGFRQAGGRSVYLISEDRRSATLISVRLGRQNPRNVEVLEGLNAGDWIISSSYDMFNGTESVVFDEPIALAGAPRQ